MAMKKFKPVTPTLRFKQILSSEDITAQEPFKPLTKGIKRSSGRNHRGVITSRRRGGGHKKLYRIIDFKRNWEGSAVVETIEYDPNRTARIALVKLETGKRAYIIAPEGVTVGTVLQAGQKASLAVGNTLALRDIPQNTQIYNIELKPGKGGQVARSAGCGAELLAKDGRYVQVRMPSGEIRRFLEECTATIGKVSNSTHMNVVSGSAGRTRWLGARPSVRGVAMNPVDHPLGGGEGRTSGGRHPVSPWGKSAKGKKTRNNKATDNMIVRRRTKKRAK